MELSYTVTKIGGKEIDDEEILNKKPWISEKNLKKFPIKIELKLKQECEVEKIEIVAHNHFIPRKIAIYANSSDEPRPKNGSDDDSDDDGYIGEVEFQKNSTNDGNSKYELKNIFIDERCSKIMLQIFDPHIDILENLDSQVGLIELKLFGKYLAGVEPIARRPQNTLPSKKNSKELLAMIDAIERNKQTAVANEDFQFAKMAQLATRQLRKSVKEVEELEKDKEEAIDDEDFQRAADLQDEITALRANILASLDPSLLDNTMPRNDEIHRPRNLFLSEENEPIKPKLYEPIVLSPTNVPSDPSHTFLLPPRPPSTSDSRRVSSSSIKKKRRSSSTTSQKKRASDSWTVSSLSPRPTTTDSEVLQRRPTTTDSEASMKRYPTTSSTTTRQRRASSSGGFSRASSTATNKFLEKENMIVPAALNRRRSSSQDIYTSDSDRTSATMNDSRSEDITEDQVLAMIPPDQRANVRGAIHVFGLETIGKLYSKHFENRKEAILEIREKIDTMSPEKLMNCFESLNCLIAHLLKETLFNIYRDALLLWHHLITSCFPALRLEKLTAKVAIETSEILANRQLSSDKRVANETSTVFRNACKSPLIAKVYGSRLISSTTKNLKGRAILIEIIAKLHNIPNDSIGFPSSTVAQFATKCIRTSDQHVRTIGKDLMLTLYKNGGSDSVRRQLQKFAETDSNNPTYLKIVKDIYNFDGGTVKSGKKKKISFML